MRKVPIIHCFSGSWTQFAKDLMRALADVGKKQFHEKNFPSVTDIEAGKVPELWPLLDLTAEVPSLVLRGEHSDLLSAAIVADMHRHHRRLASVPGRDRGHVPFLDEPESLAAIDDWLKVVDAG